MLATPDADRASQPRAVGLRLKRHKVCVPRRVWFSDAPDERLVHRFHHPYPLDLSCAVPPQERRRKPLAVASVNKDTPDADSGHGQPCCLSDHPVLGDPEREVDYPILCSSQVLPQPAAPNHSIRALRWNPRVIHRRQELSGCKFRVARQGATVADETLDDRGLPSTPPQAQVFCTFGLCLSG